MQMEDLNIARKTTYAGVCSVECNNWVNWGGTDLGSSARLQIDRGC